MHSADNNTSVQELSHWASVCNTSRHYADAECRSLTHIPSGHTVHLSVSLWRSNRASEQLPKRNLNATNDQNTMRNGEKENHRSTDGRRTNDWHKRSVLPKRKPVDEPN